MYYRGAAAAIIVYDITNPDSFAGAKSWVKELQRRGDQNVVIALVSIVYMYVFKCVLLYYVFISHSILIGPIYNLHLHVHGIIIIDII